MVEDNDITTIDGNTGTGNESSQRLVPLAAGEVAGYNALALGPGSRRGAPGVRVLLAELCGTTTKAEGNR